MVIGTVAFELKNGRKLTCEWAGNMFLVNGKISFYQVYIDSSPILVAQGKTLKGDAQGKLMIIE